MDSIEIDRGNLEDIELLRELWLSLHHHHARVAPDIGRFCDDDASWAARSRSYEEWLAVPGSFLLLARQREHVVAYAVVRVQSADEWSDTLEQSEEEAELETLVVVPEVRGSGLGTRMINVITAELKARGIAELIVGVVAGNEGAQRLYERHGFRPRWVELVRSGT